MKKKAQVTIVVIFVLSLFLSSTLLTFDSYVGPTKESDELYWDSVMSLYIDYKYNKIIDIVMQTEIERNKGR